MRAMLLDGRPAAPRGGAAHAGARAGPGAAARPRVRRLPDRPARRSTASSTREAAADPRPPDRRRGRRDRRAASACPWLGWTCGECRYCASGRENLCDRARFTGYQLDGGYAEYAVADRALLLPDPGRLSGPPGRAAALRRADRLPLARRLAATASGSGSTASAPRRTSSRRSRALQGRRVFAFTRAATRGAGASPARSAPSGPATRSARAGGARRGDHLRAGRRARPGRSRAVEGRDRGLRRHPHERHPVLPVRAPLGRAGAALGREPHAPRRRGVPRARAERPVRTEVEAFPLERANEALDRLRAGEIRGAAVLVRNLAQDAPRRCGRVRRRGRAAERRACGEPRPRALLRQLALRLGGAHRRRPRRARDGYWAGRLRWLTGSPAPRLLVRVAGAGALHRAAIPLIDEPILEGVVAWDPGPRLDPLGAPIALFGAPSVLLAAVTPIAIRLRARSLEEVGSTAAGSSASPPRAASSARSRPLLPHPGGRQRSAVRAGSGRAAAGRRVHRPCRADGAGGRGAPSRVGRLRVSALALAPSAGGTLSGAEARNWSPLTGLPRGRPGSLTARHAGCLPSPSLRVLFLQGHQYHRLSVVEDSTTRFLRFDNSLQSAMAAAPRSARASATWICSTSGWPTTRARATCSSSAWGGGSSEKRMLRDFPAASAHGRGAGSGRGRRRLPLLPPAARPTARRRRRRRAPLSLRGQAPLGRDRRRRVLRGRDPVPPRHARVHPAGPQQARATGASSSRTSSARSRGQGSKLFRSVYRRTGACSRPWSSTRRSCAATGETRPSQPDPGREREVLPGGGAARRALGRVRARTPSAPDLQKLILDRHDARYRSPTCRP